MSKQGSASQKLASVPRISPAEARSLLELGRAVLVDARDRRLFDEAHAEGAISASLQEIEALPRVPQLQSVPKDKVLIFYCT